MEYEGAPTLMKIVVNYDVTAHMGWKEGTDEVAMWD
jgi:hypothetical protein